jgi:hypothetical protein
MEGKSKQIHPSLLIIKVCGVGDLTENIMRVAQTAIRMNTENHKMYGEIFVDDLRVFYYYVPANPKSPCHAANTVDFDDEYERREKIEEKGIDGTDVSPKGGADES